MIYLHTLIIKPNCIKTKGSSVLTYDTIFTTKQLQTFHRSFLPPSLKYKQPSMQTAHSIETSKLF